jgi:hypothetical protein
MEGKPMTEVPVKEVWRAIPGYERFYEVSNLGRVSSLERDVGVNHPYRQPWQCSMTVHGRILKQRVRNNLPCVRLTNEDGEREERYVCELMYLAFVKGYDTPS